MILERKEYVASPEDSLEEEDNQVINDIDQTEEAEEETEEVQTETSAPQQP